VSAYRTPLDSVALHPSGWLYLPSGAHITCAPLVATGSSLWARLSPVSAQQWASSQGLRLPTPQELDALHERARYIAPVTLPSPDMLRAAGVDARDVGAVNRYRDANMASQAWCSTHDEEVADRLAQAHWVSEPVSNIGKHWVNGGGIYGWWKADGSKIQGLSYAHRGSEHVDYATTTHVVRVSETTMPKRTKQGERGDEVRAWQKHLKDAGYDPGTIDGIHGYKTEAASVAFERATAPRPAEIAMIPAKNYTVADRKRIDWIVLHSTENPIRRGTARNVAMWFGGPKAPRASAHYVVGPDETIQCVRDEHVAWAAPGANRQGLQIEMVGQAAKTDWLREGDDETAGAVVMASTAKLVAQLCRRWGIPVVRLGADRLRVGERGITTHAAVGEAFKLSDHIDPGLQNDKRWPWEAFLALVRDEARKLGG